MRFMMLMIPKGYEAVEWAKRCPGSDNEVIEIRQVQEFEDFSPEVRKAGPGATALREELERRQGS
jgi:hypothetical protein